jgi:hypothetical protein
MIAGRLEIQLTADVARLAKDMNDAKRVVGGAMQDIERYADIAKNALAGLGLGLSAGAMFLFVKHTVDAISAMKEFGQVAGVTAEALSRFEAPARMAGSSVENVAGAMFRMSKAALEARDPSTRAAAAINAIGISTSQLKGLKPDEMFELVARQLAKYSDGLDKNAVMQELFNKSGREMSRVVAQIAENGHLASTVTNEQAEAANKLNNQIVELKMNSERFWRSLISDGVPAMNGILKAFIDARKEGGLLDATIAALTTTFEKMNGDSLAQQLERAQRQLDLAKKNLEDVRNGWRGAFFTEEEIADLERKVKQLIKTRDDVRSMLHKSELDEQDRRAIAGQVGAKPPPNFDPEAFREAARLRDLDEKGWVAYAQFVFDNAEKLDTDMARINEEFWKGEDKKRTDDVAGMVKYIDATIDEYEKGLREIGDMQPSFFQASVKYWDGFVNGIESAFRSAFDSIGHGWKSALDAMKQAFQRTILDFIYQAFAKPFILQLVATAAGALGVSSLASAATNAATGSLLTSGATSLGTAGLGTASSYLFGTAGATSATGLAEPATAGLIGEGGFAATAGGWISGGASAVGIDLAAEEAASWIPYIGWIVAIAGILYQVFGHKGGGPKVGGSFLGDFSASGALVGNLTGSLDRSRYLNDETQGDAMAQTLTRNVGMSYGQALARLGGTSNGMQFGMGFNMDPAGSAQSQASALVRDSSGRVIFDQHVDAGRTAQELQTGINLEAQRAILAGLQHSDLPKDIADILNSLVATSATSDQISQILKAAQEMKDVLDAIPKLNIKGLDVATLRAWQVEGESLTQTLQRVANAYAQFDNAFMSDAQKLAAARDSVTAVFHDLGIAVPESSAAFYDLVHSIDVSTPAGRHMVEMLMQVAPAFQTVEKATQAAVAQFYSLASSLSSTFGQSYARAMLDASIAAWRAISHTPDDFDIEGYLKQMIQQGTFGQNLPFIQSLGPDALTAFNALLAAYKAWQDSMNQTTNGSLPPLTNGITNLGTAADDAARRLADAKDGVKKYLDSLLINDQLSPLSPMDRLGAARTQLDALLKLAKSGDATAMSQLPGASDAYLKIAREIFGSSSAYVDIFNAVVGQLAGVSGYDVNWQAHLVSVLPKTSTIASAADIVDLKRALLDALGGVAAANDEAVDQQTTTLKAAAGQAQPARR